ncbi:MAG: hypothetical protein ABSE46_24775 [Terracidiphilus sp.]|jgi:hypothetical protein
MGHSRLPKALEVGTYQGAAIWESGHGIEQRTRHADGIGIKVDAQWVHLYLHDGEEVVSLRRSTNNSAQIYPNMSLRDAMRERITNNLIRNCRVCSGEEEPPTDATNAADAERSASHWNQWHERRGETPPPEFIFTPRVHLHTAEWLEAEIDARMKKIAAEPGYTETGV